jgi:CheY-like chemotaxis protein
VTTPDAGGATGRRAVAVIEDQQAIAELLAEALHDAGFDPLQIPSAPGAAALVKDAAAAVVLLDVMMPEMSGWQVLEQLRADPATRETPVVITSAVYDRPGLHPLPAGGPVRFAAKPFDIAALLQTVRELAG